MNKWKKRDRTLSLNKINVELRKTENHHQNNTIFFLQASSIKWMPKLVAKV